MLGFVQIAVALLGLGLICIGGYVGMTALWGREQRSILADIGSRLIGSWYQGFHSKREDEFKDFTVKLQKGAHRFRLVFLANKYGNQNVDLTWSGTGIHQCLHPTDGVPPEPHGGRAAGRWSCQLATG